VGLSGEVTLQLEWVKTLREVEWGIQIQSIYGMGGEHSENKEGRASKYQLSKYSKLTD